MDPLTVFNQSPIKGTFVLHFMLITWALITTDWMPKIFIFYNTFFFLSLFWSLGAPQNPEPVQLSAIINLLSILLDLLCIATNYSRYHFLDWFGFSIFLLIINLIVRAITSIVLLRIYNDRNDRFGAYNIERPFSSGTGIRDAFSGGFSGRGAGRSGGYEDLDGPTSVVSSGAGGNVSSTTAAAASAQTNQAGNVPYQSVPSPIHTPLMDTK